ncbi:hypothetical protein SB48_HM08orf05071 [Heyndrickxia coagulans]|uniref:Uncharacterized protein n=1 Tax=Heyndrickxia coagulans TaxID=1398 RepID=A0AAN0WD01_HEYCO|nr:hypothetical protein SB48_HM08orf05071 [Heyndrickxia coagulans]
MRKTAEKFNEVNGMELSEIRAELENTAKKLAGFRGSL